MEGISSESLQDPVGDQLGGAEKSVKEDPRFLAREVPFHQLPMPAGAGLRGRQKSPLVLGISHTLIPVHMVKDSHNVLSSLLGVFA